MDPYACYLRFVSAIGDKDLHEANAAIADLTKWQRAGGFKPSELDEKTWQSLPQLRFWLMELQTRRDMAINDYKARH